MRHTGRRHSDGTFVRMDGAGPFARETYCGAPGRPREQGPHCEPCAFYYAEEGRIGLWRADRNAPAAEALRVRRGLPYIDARPGELRAIERIIAIEVRDIEDNIRGY